MPDAPELAALVAGVLAPFHIPHDYCEDSWYSCPMAEEGCADDSKHGCTCGADKFNAELDAASARIAKGIAAALDAHSGELAGSGSETRARFAARRAFEEASR